MPALATAGVLVGRLLQVRYGVADSLAGRSVAASWGELFLAAPAGLGAAVLAPFAEWLDVDDLAWGGVVLVVLAAWPGRRWAPVAAACLALGPVLAIGIGRDELLANTRYLYLSAALAAPVVPLGLADVLARWRLGPRLAPALAVVSLGLAAWNGLDRVLEGARTTRAVAPVLDAVLDLPRGSAVTVLTAFYDEPTARLLMSQWLAHRRGVRARYVMRGTGLTYVRRGGGPGDTALSYFGPAPRRFAPSFLADGERVLLQDVGPATVEAVTLPKRSGGAAWAGPVVLRPVAGVEDAGRVEAEALVVERTVGPVAAATLEPLARFEVSPGAWGSLRLRVRASSSARGRYAAGYHDRWLALFFGPPPFDTRRAVSMELRADGRPEDLVVQLAWDPVLSGFAGGEVGLLPLSYPGRVVLEQGPGSSAGARPSAPAAGVLAAPGGSMNSPEAARPSAPAAGVLAAPGGSMNSPEAARPSAPAAGVLAAPGGSMN